MDWIHCWKDFIFISGEVWEGNSFCSHLIFTEISFESSFDLGQNVVQFDYTLTVICRKKLLVHIAKKKEDKLPTIFQTEHLSPLTCQVLVITRIFEIIVTLYLYSACVLMKTAAHVPMLIRLTYVLLRNIAGCLLYVLSDEAVCFRDMCL